LGTIAERIDKKFAKVKKWEKANPGLSWSKSEYEVAEPKIYIPKEMLSSPVYRGLSRVAMLLLQDFLAKRIMKQASKKSGLSKTMEILFSLFRKQWKRAIQEISSGTVLMNYSAQGSLI
jgi:hypothetical protein